MKTYFSLAIADNMFTGNVLIQRCELSPTEVKKLVEHGVVSCCNPSHNAVLNVLRARFDITVPAAETPPRVELVPGDSIIVLGVRGLPRLTDRHEYTDEEVAFASLTFSMYSVI